jgi:hypothetical protein
MGRFADFDIGRRPVTQRQRRRAQAESALADIAAQIA